MKVGLITIGLLMASIPLYLQAKKKIDRQLYDALNSYTGEPGSDGVVRVTAANMNYSLLKLHQEGNNGENLVVAKMTRTQPIAFGVLPGCSHSGKKMGIIRSITMANASTHPTAIWVLRCRVTTPHC